MTKRKEYEFVDKIELMNLAKFAKSWDFTCTFCFKRFASAQAMGGHQNAHRKERTEEKENHVKDYIGHRMRTYILSKKSNGGSSTATVKPWSSKDSSVANINGKNSKIEADFVVKNRLELSLGVGGDDVKDGKENSCIHDFKNAGYGINRQDLNLDLTLKL